MLDTNIQELSAAIRSLEGLTEEERALALEIVTGMKDDAGRKAFFAKLSELAGEIKHDQDEIDRLLEEMRQLAEEAGHHVRVLQRSAAEKQSRSAEIQEVDQLLSDQIA
ncbi:MAG: hypothetical protein WCG83_05750 [Candidatus Peregrinibacteria bacterium]